MANSKIKGITIEIGGSTTKLGNSLSKVENQTKNLQKELRGVNTLLKNDPSNTVLLTQKQELLTNAIKETSEKLKILKDTQVQVQEQFDKGQITSEQYRDFQREIVATEQKLKSLNNELKNFSSVAGQKLQVAGEKIQNAGEKIQNAGSNVTNFGKKLAPATTAIMGLGIAGISTTADFEESMSQVAATMGMTTDEINKGSKDYKKLEDAARDMGKKTKYSAKDAADALNYLALAGYDTDKSIKTLPTVLNLAAAGNIDLAYASDMVTDAMSALGDSAGTADEFVDKMAKTSQKSNTNVAQLGEAILTVGGTAKVLSGKTTELNTCLGILADNGIKGAEGGTALRNIILSLSAPTDTAAKKIKELGLKAFDANGNLRPMNEIFNDLNGVLSTMSQGEQTAVLNEIFNKTDLKSVNALLANSGDRFNQLSSEINSSEGAAKKMADTMSNNLKGNITTLNSALSEAGISIGKTLNPYMKDMVKTVQKATDRFNSLNDGTKRTILKIAGVTAVVSPLIIATGKTIEGFGKITTSIGKFTSSTGKLITKLKAMTSAQNASNKSVLANPYVLATTALVGLTVAAVAYSEASDKNAKRLKKEAEAMKEETRKIKEQEQAYRDNINARNDSIREGVAEINHYKSLYHELSNIVDANGKVKEGYEGRADFIVSTLKDALGVEIDLIGNQINGYKDLSKSFDNIIEKKKAMLILDSQEDSYSNAITNKDKELSSAYNAKEKMEQALKDVKKYEAEYQKKSKYSESGSLSSLKAWDKLTDAQKIYKEAEKQYNSHMRTYNNYLNTIGMYETNYQLTHDEKYDEIMATEQDYKVYQAINGKQSKNELKKLINNTEKELNNLKKLKKKNNTDIYNDEIQSKEKQLSLLKKSLNDQKNAVSEGNNAITSEWLNQTAQRLNELTGKNYEFRQLGDGTIQCYIDGIKYKKPIAESEMSNFAYSMINQVSSKKENAIWAAESLLDGVVVGLRSSSKRAAAVSAAADSASLVLSAFRQTFKTHSPSKVTEGYGINLNEGVALGLKNSKKQVINSALRNSADIVSSMQDGLNGKLNLPSFQKNMLMEVNTNFTNSKYQAQQNNKIQELMGSINKYMPLILENMGNNIVLEDGTLVGKIASKMDAKLGELTTRKLRG